MNQRTRPMERLRANNGSVGKNSEVLNEIQPPAIDLNVFDGLTEVSDEEKHRIARRLITDFLQGRGHANTLTALLVLMVDYNSEIVSSVKIVDNANSEERISFDKLSTPLNNNEVSEILPLLIEFGVVSLHGFTNRNEAAKPVFNFHREKCNQILTMLNDSDLREQMQTELEAARKQLEEQKEELKKYIKNLQDKETLMIEKMKTDLKEQFEKRSERFESTEEKMIAALTEDLDYVRKKREAVDAKIEALKKIIQLFKEKKCYKNKK